MIQRKTSGIDPRKHRNVEGPVRTCVGCRKRELAVELLRVVAATDGNGATASEALVVDTAGNLPGRGAWLHSDPKCLDAAIRRRAFARALRITGSPDTSAVVEFVSAFSGADALAHPATEQVAKNMSTP